MDVVNFSNPKKMSKAVLLELLEQDFFQRYEYGDFVRFARKILESLCHAF